jgi:hypothetical protein
MIEPSNEENSKLLSDALQQIQVFVAVLLSERTGSLTSVQRDLLISMQIAGSRLEAGLTGLSHGPAHGGVLDPQHLSEGCHLGG